MADFDNRVAFITGAAHGQGRATALALAKNGADIAAFDVGVKIEYPAYAYGTGEELKSLKRFKPGMIWKAAGGTQAVYNDNDDWDYTDPETGNDVHISKNVAIIPTTYEMTHSRDYKLLLSEIQLYSEYRRERE